MTSPEWLAADEDDSDRFPQTAHVPALPATHSPDEGSRAVPDPARVAYPVRAAETWMATAPKSLADEERASLAAALSEVTQDRDEWKQATIAANRRFEAAEAEVARLTEHAAGCESTLRLWNDEREAAEELVREMGREAVTEAEAYRAVLARAEAAEAEVERLRGERDLMARHVREARELTEAAEAKVAKVKALAEGGVGLIAAERQRQIDSEGFTAEHDAEHDNDALARAAACYAMPERLRELAAWAAPGNTGDRGDRFRWMPRWWPWSGDDWKPSPADRVRELVKAGALIAAEIDRLRAVLADAPAERPDLDRPCACGHLLTDHLDGLACYAGTTVTSEFACDCREWRPGAPAEQRAEGGA